MKKSLNRLPVDAEQGRIKGSQLLVDASLICTKIHESHPNLSERQYLEMQEEYLENYAKEAGVWIDDFSIEKYGQYLSNGAENIVYANETQVLTKINDFCLHISPLEFFERTAIHNHLFPEAPYVLIGFMRNPKRNDAFSAVIQQNFIVADCGVEYDEVSAYMKSLGFEDIGKTYVNEWYVVSDLHPGNIIKMPCGNLAIIDDVTLLNTPDEDCDGEMVYGTSTEPNAIKISITKAHKERNELILKSETLKKSISFDEKLLQTQKIESQIKGQNKTHR